MCSLVVVLSVFLLHKNNSKEFIDFKSFYPNYLFTHLLYGLPYFQTKNKILMREHAHK